MASGFNINGSDIEGQYISKSYLLDRYPEIANQFKSAELWAWGRNNNGQLGDNTVVDKSSPVQTVSAGANWKQITSSLGSGAIKTDGTFWAWGGPSSGNTGAGIVPDGTSTKRSSPVVISSGATNWKQISHGFYTGSGIKTDGTFWVWASGNQGQGGNSTTVDSYTSPNQVGSSTIWKQASSGGFYVAGIKTDGTLWTWGQNGRGQLGDNTSNAKSSPVQTVAGGTNWKQVSAGYHSSAAIKTDGTLWMWGENNYGQLGDNTITKKSSPVQTVAGGSNWQQASAGGYYCGAIKTDGTLWTWGNNGHGELGVGDITWRSSPVQTVAGGTNWKKISCAPWYANIGALKTDGTLWTWGRNDNGQLGDNTSTSKSSPVQTVAGGNNWKDIAHGYNVVLAIRDDSMELNFGAGTL